MKKMIFWFLVGVNALPVAGQTNEEIFSKLVGEVIRFDSLIVDSLLNFDSNKKYFVDSDGDGIKDACYFIDRADKHGDSKQPLVVKVIDEDGDWGETGEGDYDSDLYVADWFGDGEPDRIIDYNDLDGDNDVDEQYLYGFRRGDVFAAWVKDYGDDNRLWYSENYEYFQPKTQWKSDFNGDEMCVYYFKYDYHKNTLTPCFETAFSFYDLDGDDYTEEVIRFSGDSSVVDDLRYSVDIDNDNSKSVPYHHDFDFSITALGPVVIPLEKSRKVEIRERKTDIIIKWEEMRDFSKEAEWNKFHLTWDENDNNVSGKKQDKKHERWEGVLNHPNDYMKQVGGPSCGAFNKRNEVDQDASGKMRFYYSPMDQRLHLFGAEVGWIDVDYDYDDELDLKVFMEDINDDGFFDCWKYDVDGDGIYEKTVVDSSVEYELIEFDYYEIQQKYMGFLQKSISLNNQMIELIKTLLNRINLDFQSDIENYYNNDLICYGKDYGLGEKILKSTEGKRYYYDLIRIEYWNQLEKSEYACLEDFDGIESLYEQGDYQKVNFELNRYVARDVVPLKKLMVYQGFPNPFNSIARFKFFIPEKRDVSIQLFNVLGRKLEEIERKELSRGFHELTWEPENIASGLILYKVKAGKDEHVGKLMLVK